MPNNINSTDWLFSIVDNKEYKSAYNSMLLRGCDNPFTPRPWDLIQEIGAISAKNKILLDIGCGTGFKLLPLSPLLDVVYGVDPSQSMLDAAKKVVKSNNISNIRLVRGIGQKLPFISAKFDIITCMLSRWDAQEIHRVLKSDGELIIESIGCEDKQEFKYYFGKDDKGWRGQYADYEKDFFLERYYNIINSLFEEVVIKNGFWETFYTKEGLKHLLSYTPIIRNYNPESDSVKLEEAIKHLQTDKGVKLIQNRVFIHAKHPRIL